MTREEIQQQALNIAKEHNYTGILCLDMGSGKSKVAIDCIKQGSFKNILITSPRTNLKEMWRKELAKWGIKDYRVGIDPTEIVPKFDKILWRYNDIFLNITIENIQTCYKWTKEKIKQFDLIICDEVHLIATLEYGQLIINARELNIPVIGLTGTLNLEDTFKKEFYNTHIPILLEYYDSAKDGLINKRHYYIYKYKLDDSYKIITGSKKKKWQVGELSQYSYLTEQIKKGQKLMAQTGSQDWFKDAADWFWKGNGTTTEKNAARIYLQAIKYRKEFLWNLSSSADIAVRIKNRILDTKTENKVLLFSELTTQAEKLSAYSIHSKQDEDTNKELLHMFDSGNIKELSAVRSLSLGLNLVGANWAILESFNSSSTDILQKMGRTNRLDTNEVANIVIIVPVETQSETWFNKFIEDINERDPDMAVSYINSINEII